MFEMTYGELFLFVWAVAATAGAWQFRTEARERSRMLMGASMFIKKVVEDDALRDELRRVITKDKEAEFKFGVGE
jgi:hypothetical protein